MVPSISTFSLTSVISSKDDDNVGNKIPLCEECWVFSDIHRKLIISSICNMWGFIKRKSFFMAIICKAIPLDAWEGTFWITFGISTNISLYPNYDHRNIWEISFRLEESLLFLWQKHRLFVNDVFEIDIETFFPNLISKISSMLSSILIWGFFLVDTNKSFGLNEFPANLFFQIRDLEESGGIF